jgi:hypothetical protein
MVRNTTRNTISFTEIMTESTNVLFALCTVRACTAMNPYICIYCIEVAVQLCTLMRMPVLVLVLIKDCFILKTVYCTGYRYSASIILDYSKVSGTCTSNSYSTGDKKLSTS